MNTWLVKDKIINNKEKQSKTTSKNMSTNTKSTYYDDARNYDDATYDEKDSHICGITIYDRNKL